MASPAAITFQCLVVKTRNVARLKTTIKTPRLTSGPRSDPNQLAMATTAARPRRAVASTGDQEVRCIPISKSPDVHDIWTLTSASLVQSQPHQIIIQAKIVDWVFANVVIETPPVNSETDMPSTIDHLVSTGLQLCRQTYGRSAPTFASTVSIQMNNRQPVVVERISQELLDELTCIDSLLGPSASEVSLVPRTNLVPVLSPGFFFCPNTRLVTHKGGKFVAKGPIYASRVEDDFLEAKNLLELPRGHPHIMPPPDVFVTVSEVDRRICGFLVPFLPNGNLDIYAPKLQAGGGLTEARLVRWFCQIVDAVAFLIEHGTWHGDLKPDNILVDDDGNLKLIDFTRKFTTDATASPEVRQHYAR